MKFTGKQIGLKLLEIMHCENPVIVRLTIPGEIAYDNLQIHKSLISVVNKNSKGEPNKITVSFFANGSLQSLIWCKQGLNPAFRLPHCEEKNLTPIKSLQIA